MIVLLQCIDKYIITRTHTMCLYLITQYMTREGLIESVIVHNYREHHNGYIDFYLMMYNKL